MTSVIIKTLNIYFYCLIRLRYGSKIMYLSLKSLSKLFFMKSNINNEVCLSSKVSRNGKKKTF